MERNPLARMRRETIVFCFLSAGLVLVAAYVGALVVLLLRVPRDSMWASIITELAVGAAAASCVVALGGVRLYTPSSDDAATVVRLAWWDVVVSLGIMALEIAGWYREGEAPPADWLMRLVQVVSFCLFVGLFEEAFFRGIVFQGLLAWLGGTHRGVIRTVLLTSFFFGLMHIDFAVARTDAMTLLQALLKVIQTGMYSFLLCVIVLRTRRLAGVGLLHALDDTLILLPDIVLYGGSFDTEYVSPGENAPYVVALYLLVIALYLPFVIAAARELRRGRYVTYGVFVECRSLSKPAVASASLPAFESAPTFTPASTPQVPASPVEGLASTPVTQQKGAVPVPLGVPSHKPPMPDGFRPLSNDGR